MTEEELRELLLSTISKIKKHNEWEKQLSQQKFQMKMHEMMEKTYDVTRKSNTKFINMFKDQISQMREREEQRALLREYQERSRTSSPLGSKKHILGDPMYIKDHFGGPMHASSLRHN